MDPIASINPRKDSTLAMMLAAQKRGWQLFYIEQSGLFAHNGTVYATRHEVEVQDDPAGWFNIIGTRQEPVSDLDAVLLRKDPPFDLEYIYTTYLLELAEQAGTKVLNRPGSVRDSNEKLFTLQFPECCPPLMVSRDQDLLRSFHGEHGDVIYKPLDGMGGESVFRASNDDPNLNVIIETLTRRGTRQIMAQRYIPEITEGDTRILLINGEPVPYGLARIPAKGETRANLASGGHGVGRELTDRDYWICDQVGPTLKEKGLYFTGIDVIGDYLTEINVTCPTCIRELDHQYDLDIAGDYMDFAQTLLD